MAFDPHCRRCQRLSSFLDRVAGEYSHYHAAPVAPFGDPDARLLVVGLAPGMHGANATGRPFTGDHAGILLYETLHANGFSNQAEATAADDGLRLYDCRITNAVKCLPPQNKPVGAEINTCNRFLSQELAELPPSAVIVALGAIAHQAVLKGFKLRQQAYRFAHGAEHTLPDGRRLLDSYHCSRYNTQTRRLTPKMFNQVFRRARRLLV
ncbi:MAG: uracil-DNA glycosylase [Candidatus Thiodiazotropha sp.]|jgi:uracil-DNA glycosylase